MKKEELDLIANKLNEENTDRDTFGYIVGPLGVKAKFDLQEAYNKNKGDVAKYEPEPWEKLTIFAIKVSNPNSGDPVFRLVDQYPPAT